MTLPPGLQTHRDSGVAWCNEKQFAALLDLIETLAGALEQYSDGIEHGPCGRCDRARAALDKYREWE